MNFLTKLIMTTKNYFFIKTFNLMKKAVFQLVHPARLIKAIAMIAVFAFVGLGSVNAQSIAPNATTTAPGFNPKEVTFMGTSDMVQILETEASVLKNTLETTPALQDNPSMNVRLRYYRMVWDGVSQGKDVGVVLNSSYTELMARYGQRFPGAVTPQLYQDVIDLLSN